MDKPTSRSFVWVELRLRTPQVEFLEHLEQKFEVVGESRVLRRLLAKRIKEEEPREIAVSPCKHRKQLLLGIKHIAYLDTLCRRYGLSRSDMVRRLLDDEMENHRAADAAIRNAA